MKIDRNRYDYYIKYDAYLNKLEIYRIDREGMPDERPTFCDDDYEPPIVYDVCTWEGGFDGKCDWEIEEVLTEDGIDKYIDDNELAPMEIL